MAHGVGLGLIRVSEGGHIERVEKRDVSHSLGGHPHEWQSGPVAENFP